MAAAAEAARRTTAAMKAGGTPRTPRFHSPAAGLLSSTGWAGLECSDTLGEVQLIEGGLATAAKLTATAYQSDADAAAADAAAVAVGDKMWAAHEKEAAVAEPIYNELDGQPVRASVL